MNKKIPVSIIARSDFMDEADTCYKFMDHPLALFEVD